MISISDAVSEAYTDVLRECGEDGSDMTALRLAVEERVTARFEAGEIRMELAAVIRSELGHVDRRNAKQTDRIINLLREGWDALDLSVDSVLDLSVTLGKGKRKLWRHVNGEDLRQMDELRYENARKQQVAYSEWRPDFQYLDGVLRQYETVGDAFAAGAFGVAEAELVGAA